MRKPLKIRLAVLTPNGYSVGRRMGGRTISVRANLIKIASAYPLDGPLFDIGVARVTVVAKIRIWFEERCTSLRSSG